MNSKVTTTVVTISNRPHNLPRCVEQVNDQDTDEILEHIMVLDGVTLSPDEKQQLFDTSSRAQLRIIERPAQLERHIWERLGALRNHGIRCAAGDLIALLDDDNELEPAHLSSGAKVLRRDPRCDATHSWRTLWTESGEQHLVDDGLYPWVLGGDRKRQMLMFEIQVAAGILTPGSPIVRDRYDFDGPDGERACCVDTGEWVFRKETILKCPFVERFTYTETLFGMTDDYLLGCRMLEAGIRVIPIERPTLRYFLGGNSQVVSND